MMRPPLAPPGPKSGGGGRPPRPPAPKPMNADADTNRSKTICRPPPLKGRHNLSFHRVFKVKMFLSKLLNKTSTLVALS